MIYTFEFVFSKNDDLINEWDSTQFCAESEEEAEKMFKEFAYENQLPGYYKEPAYIVYDPYDANEYGEEYGMELIDGMACLKE